MSTGDDIFIFLYFVSQLCCSNFGAFGISDRERVCPGEGVGLGYLGICLCLCSRRTDGRTDGERCALCVCSASEAELFFVCTVLKTDKI